ncbi:hypothetical protein BHM03_00058758 [Ensete ventricosum]|nr:hypothetical protein BHM03_00058758 [Ensete ventricosum]
MLPANPALSFLLPPTLPSRPCHPYCRIFLPRCSLLCLPRRTLLLAGSCCSPASSSSSDPTAPPLLSSATKVPSSDPLPPLSLLPSHLPLWPTQAAATVAAAFLLFNRSLSRRSSLPLQCPSLTTAAGSLSLLYSSCCPQPPSLLYCSLPLSL